MTFFPNSGNIPKLRFSEFTEEWEVKKLGEICKMQAGKFVSASEILKETDDKLYPCYGANGLRGFTYSYNYEGEYSLIGRQGALCGNVTRVNDKFYATEHAVVVTPKDNVHSVWLFYLLNYLNLNQYATGMAQPGLSVHNLLEVESIMANSIDEQYKTASLLTLIDTRILTQRKIIEKLETLMKESREKIFLRKIKFKDDNFSKWEEKKLGDILIESNEKSIKNNQYRVISSTAKGLFYQDDYFTRDIASQDNTGYKILKKEQLVFSPQNLWLGNINVNIDFEIGLVSPSYKIFNFNTSLTSYSYCNFFLKTSLMLFEYAQSSIQGASVVRRNLDLNMFFNIRILLPSIKEQAKITSFLSSIQKKIDIEKQILENLELQKNFLLANLFV